jgi:Putative Flp pilus-assembly TadE/G-like
MSTRKFISRLRIDAWDVIVGDVLHIIKRCRDDRRGATAIMIALAMTMLLGCAGLATEAAGWYVKKRQMQGAADAAAASAAAALGAGSSVAIAQTEGQSVAAQNGFTNGAGETTVTVNSPPLSGPNQGNAGAAEVIINQSEPMLLSSLFLDSQPTLAARSVALTSSTGGAGSGGGGECLLVLSPNATNALLLNGNVSVNLTCGVMVDSSSTQAMLMNGSNSVTASNINVVGNVLKNPTSGNTTTPNPSTGATSLADPYANVDPPSFSGCTYPSGVTINGTSGTLNPGVYCGNIVINGSGITVTVNPGTYILDRHSLIINGSPTVSGNGVTFVFTTSTGSGVGNLTVNGSPVVDLTAPSSGSLAGFVFYQDRRGTSGSNTFNGATGSSIAGAMYFPNESLTYNGTPQSSSCTQVIAKTITLNGTPSLQVTGCSALGLSPIGGSGSGATASNQIVE